VIARTGQQRNFFFLLVLLLIAAGSVRYFQTLFGPMIDSDQSIWILIARDPHFPDALYFYGQDRLGSLLPLLAHLLVLTGVPALYAMTVVNVLIQCTTAFLIARISGSRSTGWIIGLLLLFPPWTLYNLGMIGHPYTTQLFLWTCILWLMGHDREWSVRKGLLLVALCLLSVWTSELSLLFLPLIVAALWFGHRLRDVKFWLWSSAAMLLGMGGLFLIKMKLPGSGSSFLSFADPAEMRANLDGCINVFRCYWNKGAGGAWGLGLLLLLTGLSWIIGKKTALSRLTLVFGLLALLFTIWSEWVFLNDSSIRYWALRLVRVLRLLWLSAILWAGWDSTHYAVEGFRFTPDRPSRAEITEIAKKIDGHVLADYWSLYLLQVFDPKLKVSHPEPWAVRDLWNWEEVVQADSIWCVNLPCEEQWMVRSDTLVPAAVKEIQIGQSRARLYYRP
jgi:hypothetical protein